MPAKITSTHTVKTRSKKNTYPATGSRQEIIILPPDIGEYRFITIHRKRNEPVTAEEAKEILRVIGVSEENIESLQWQNYKEG